MDSFGEYIKKLRKERNFSKSELARRIGVTPQYMRSIEEGHYIPSEEKIDKLVSTLDADRVLTFKIADKIPVDVYDRAKREFYRKGE